MQESNDDDESEEEDHSLVEAEEIINTEEPISKTEPMGVYNRSLASSSEINESSVRKRCFEIEDEYDAIGINVAAKLRTLPRHMRIIAEKLINDVLYMAQSNNLDASSVIGIQDPIKHDIL